MQQVVLEKPEEILKTTRKYFDEERFRKILEEYKKSLVFRDNKVEQNKLIIVVAIKVANKAHYRIPSAEFKRLALQELERE